MPLFLAQSFALPDSLANLDLPTLERQAFWITQLGWLGIVALGTLSVWLYYRHRTFPPAQRTETILPRLAEGTLDSLVYWPLGFLIAYLALQPAIPSKLNCLLGLGGYLCWLLYIVIMHRRYGQTLGKMIVHVRVVDFRTGGALTWGQAWLRDGLPISLAMVSGVLTLILPTPLATSSPPSLSELQTPDFLTTLLPGTLFCLWYVAEILCVLLTPQRRALHDLLAGTLVIRTNFSSENPPPLPASSA